jgi:hypothetical protein
MTSNVCTLWEGRPQLPHHPIAATVPPPQEFLVWLFSEGTALLPFKHEGNPDVPLAPAYNRWLRYSQLFRTKRAAVHRRVLGMTQGAFLDLSQVDNAASEGAGKRLILTKSLNGHVGQPRRLLPRSSRQVVAQPPHPDSCDVAA